MNHKVVRRLVTTALRGNEMQWLSLAVNAEHILCLVVEDDLLKHMTSMRTQYSRCRTVVARTPRQKWLVRELGFLKPYIKARLRPPIGRRAMVFQPDDNNNKAIEDIITSLRCCLLVNHLLATGHVAHCAETWRHPRNRNYMTYRIVVRGPSHNHKYHVQKISWSLDMSFSRCAIGQTERHTDTLVAILCTPSGGRRRSNNNNNNNNNDNHGLLLVTVKCSDQTICC